MTGKYKVKLKAIDQGTCVGQDSTYTTVYVYKPLGFASEDESICFGSSTQVTAGGGVLYLWTSKEDGFKSEAASPIVSPSDNSIFFVSITDFQGCVAKDTVLVTVVPGIDLKYEWKKKFRDCFSRPSLEVTNLSDPSEEVFFDFGDGTTSDLNEAIHEYERDSTYFIRLVGKREFCIYEKREEIPIYSVKVPNVITPTQSPGKNDTFKTITRGRSASAGGAQVSLIVYNRWGEKVHADEDYHDNWDAEGLAAGVYYYEVKISQESLTCKGWVQVIR